MEILQKKVKFLLVLRTTYQNSAYLCVENQGNEQHFMLNGLVYITISQLNNQQQNNQNQNNQVPMVIPLDQQVS